jgi:hypothetical protein
MIGFGIYHCKKDGTDIFVTEQSKKEMWVEKNKSSCL